MGSSCGSIADNKFDETHQQISLPCPGRLTLQHFQWPGNYAHVIWLMESPPCIDDVPIQTSIDRGFQIAMFHYQNSKFTKCSSLELLRLSSHIQSSHSPHRIYRKNFTDLPFAQSPVKHHIPSDSLRFRNENGAHMNHERRSRQISHHSRSSFGSSYLQIIISTDQVIR